MLSTVSSMEATYSKHAVFGSNCQYEWINIIAEEPQGPITLRSDAQSTAAPKTPWKHICGELASINFSSMFAIVLLFLLQFPQQQNRKDVVNRKAPPTWFIWLLWPEVTLMSGAALSFELKNWNTSNFFVRPKMLEKHITQQHRGALSRRAVP